MTSWRDSALCRISTIPPDVWIGHDRDPIHVREAKALCDICPVIEDCRQDMLAGKRGCDVAGVVAGTSDEDRRGRRGRRVKGCGTNAGYKRHHMKGTPPCGACKRAHAEYRQQRREAS